MIPLVLLSMECGWSNVLVDENKCSLNLVAVCGFTRVFMRTNDVLVRSYLQHFEGNDDLVANVSMPMNEVIDYRLNKIKFANAKVTFKKCNADMADDDIMMGC